VRVIAQQFAWHFQYLDEQGKPTTNTLYLPKDKPVKFDVVTRDVLHSFWVPSFRLKTDTVPGLTTHIRVTPNKFGTFDIVCAELCGLGHSVMRQNAHVVTQQAFDAWLAKQKPGASAGGSAPGASAAASPTIPSPAG
jgi:cytochrome c oxidase subunit 2